ncbi:hypothetical protein GOBAR_AA13477 [Gossypium barbadense]|uniref:Uncharacterized protein n=1 Tax=Gossypium barbadense TaxID=3634 RepID=A0A2P5XV39_GOSBA|nr:hypothetical protein GOBAR_AA13477 [Gossypium barbadense]
MYDEFLKLRVLESDRFESGGGYSGCHRGSLGHKSCAKRILYLVVAMVVVEQDMAVMENLPRWSCSSYVMMSLGVLYNCDKTRNFLGDVRKVLESDRFESGGGYSGCHRGSLGHKSCAKRILYLVVAMVVVEQDMAVMENLPRWSCSSYVMMSLGVLYNCDKTRNFLGDVRKYKDSKRNN